MIVNLSLFTIFLCFFMIVVWSILNKVKIYPSTKGILCFGMLAMIGGMTRTYHNSGDWFLDAILVSISILIVRQTIVARRRGFL